MNQLLVTQCPYCQTRFRLTPEQLSVAAGKVRCGACLEIFQALEVPLAASATAIVAAPNPVTPDSTELSSQNSLDEPDLEALGLDDSIIAELNPASRSESWLAEAETQPEAPSLSAIPTNADHGSLGDLHADFLATTPARDFGPDHVPYQQPQIGSSASQPTASHADDTTTISAYAVSQNQSRTEHTLKDLDLQQDSDLRRDPGIGTLAAVDLLDEVLFQEPPPRRPQRLWLWGTLCLLALLALPAQFVYYNFDAMARDQRTRPVLESLCLLASCEVPARVDISRLRSANLLVRTDAEFPNALAIDVILYNRADFVQPFPILQMQFTDAGGRTVASRRFRPEEYLSGELAGVQLMPPQTPIHVALKMLNPGPQASGYSLEFVSP